MRLTITQGDTARLDIPVKTADGAPLDLTAFVELKFIIKRSSQDSDAAALFLGTLSGGEITVSGDDNDHALVRVDPESSANLRFGRAYFWELEITDSTDVYTPCSGDILADYQLSNG